MTTSSDDTTAANLLDPPLPEEDAPVAAFGPIDPALAAPPEPPRLTRRLLALAAAAALVIGGSFAAWRFWPRPPPPSVATIPVVSTNADTQQLFVGAALHLYEGETQTALESGAAVSAREPDAIAPYLLLALRPPAADAVIAAQEASARRPPASGALLDALATLRPLAATAAGAEVDDARLASGLLAFNTRHPTEFFLRAVLLAAVAPRLDDTSQIALFEALAQVDPSPPQLAALHAGALRRAERYDDCRAVLAAAMAIRPHAIPLAIESAELLYAEKRPVQALAVLEQVAADHPTSLEVQRMLLHVTLRAGDDAARMRHLALLRAGTFPLRDAGGLLAIHAVELLGRYGRLADALPVFDAAADALVAAGDLAGALALRVDERTLVNEVDAAAPLVEVDADIAALRERASTGAVLDGTAPPRGLLRPPVHPLGSGRSAIKSIDLCVSLRSIDQVMCRPTLVRALAAAAQAAHAAGDRDEAARIAVEIDRLWPRNADAPTAVAARAHLVR